MKKVGIKIDAEKMGWRYEKSTLGDGSELHYFPVIVLSHGVLGAPLGVLISDTNVVLIQAGTAALCRFDQHDPAICTNTKDGFFELLKRMHAKSVKN